MLLNSHYLNSIITKSFDAWQHLISEVGICVYFWLLHFAVGNIVRIVKENANKISSQMEERGRCMRKNMILLFINFFLEP